MTTAEFEWCGLSLNSALLLPSRGNDCKEGSMSRRAHHTRGVVRALPHDSGNSSHRSC